MDRQLDGAVHDVLHKRLLRRRPHTALAREAANEHVGPVRTPALCAEHCRGGDDNEAALHNRQAVLHDAVDRTTVVSQALVHALSEGAIDAADCARGGAVAAVCAGQHNSSAEVHAVLAVLASIVALCIHDFLNAQLATLVRQRTNVQTVQRAVLDCLRVLGHVLVPFNPNEGQDQTSRLFRLYPRETNA